MANVIQIKRSATHSAITAPTNLAVGELGYVQGSKELYICRSTDNTGGTEIIHAALPLGGADTIDTLGEIGEGTWAADVIGSSYLPDATTEVEGVVELASNDETNTGTDTSRALTASNLTAWASDTTTAIASGKLPTASTTQVGITVLADSDETNTGTDATRAVTPDGLNDWTGNTAITSVGTIATGTWNATSIAAGKLPALNSITAPDGDVALNSKKITGLADPEDAQDAATKAYVDAHAQGLDVKESVKVATTAPVTIATALVNAELLDGVDLATGDRVLVKNQTTASQNGIYIVGANPARAGDFDESDEVSGGTFTFVEEGTVNADSGWVVTTDGTITVGTTALAFTQFSGAGQIVAGTGLTKSSNTINAVGTSNRISVGADAIDIDANYVGQNTITTLGTIATGTWNGTAINATYLDGQSGTNTGDMSIAGEDYLSLTNQVLTANEVDLTDNVTGTLPVGSGGTGLTTITENAVVYGNSTGALQVLAVGGDGQVLMGNDGNPPGWTSTPAGMTIDCGTF